MNEVASLRAEIERIKDVEAIKCLKYRYIRSMTLSLWDELESLLTEDVSTSYSTRGPSFAVVRRRSSSSKSVRLWHWLRCNSGSRARLCA